MEIVEDPVNAAGGRVHDAWGGTFEWSGDSEFLSDLAASLGLTTLQVDELFGAAGAIQNYCA